MFRISPYQAWIESTKSGTALSFHLLLLVIVLAFASISYWAYNATLDEVTRGKGRIIPSSKTQIIQNLEGGIVAEILVKEGDRVNENQLLIQLDHTQFSANLQEVRTEQLNLSAKMERLRSEATNTPFIPPSGVQTERPDFINSERQLLQSRREALNSAIEVLNNQRNQQQHELRELGTTIEGLKTQFQLGKKELSIARPLTKKGILPEIELVRLEREVAHIEGELNRRLASAPRLESVIKETQQQIHRERASFQARAQNELNESRAAFAQLQETLPTLNDRLQRTEIRSPVIGTIKQINTQTIGGIIQPGFEIMEIVPEEKQLLVEAQIRPADIAFLHPGQSANIKLTAYDSTIYGGLSATVEHISADTIQNRGGDPFYLIHLRTHDQHLFANGEKLPIIPGMIATVEILTGQKTVLDYLLKPLLKTQQNALRER